MKKMLKKMRENWTLSDPKLKVCYIIDAILIAIIIGLSIASIVLIN